NFEKAKDAAAVEAWYAEQGLTTRSPRQLSYNFLDSYDVQLVQGRRVPHLLFYFPGNNDNRPALAHVYIFSEATFSIGDVPDIRSTSSYSLEFLRDQGYLY